MTLVIRLIAAMTALLTAAALGWLAHGDSGGPILSTGLATVTGIPALALLLGWVVAGKSVAASTRAGMHDRMADELREKIAALADESRKRRTIERDLEQYEQRERMFSAAVESASYPIITKTLDGTITGWNRSAERLYGYSEADAIGRSVTMIAPPERGDEVPSLLRRVARGERVALFETERVRKAGSRVPVALSLPPVRDFEAGIVEIKSFEMVVWRRTLCVSTMGVSPVTVIVSCSVPTFRSALIVAVNEPVSSMPSRLTLLKPVSENVTT